MAVVLKGRGPKVEVRRNLVTNPSFERDTTGWVSISSGGDFSATSPLARSTDWAKYGDASAHIVVDKGATSTLSEWQIRNPLGTSGVPVEAGETYAARAALNVIQEPSVGIQLAIFWYTEEGSLLSATGTGFQTGDGELELGHIATAPATTAFASYLLQIRSNVSEETVELYTDAWQFERTGVSGPYFDGSGYVDADGVFREDDTGEEVEWTGEPNASESIRYARPFVPAVSLKIKHNGAFTEAPAFLRQNDLWVPGGDA